MAVAIFFYFILLFYEKAQGEHRLGGVIAAPKGRVQALKGSG
jgi:hypothetical protein